MKNKYKIAIIIVIIAFVGISIFGIIKNNGGKYPSYVKHAVINDEFFNSMSDKELICYKILNSIDFYNTAQGTYTEGNEIDKQYTTNKYYADIDNRKTRLILDSNYEVLVNNDKRYWIDKNKKTYKESEVFYEKDDNIAKLKVEDRYKETIVTREDGEFLDILSVTLFNQSETANSLKNFDNWSIAENISYLNREAVKINGNFNIVGKTDEKTFQIIVDSNTGIILEKKTFNTQGNLVTSFETKEILIDKEIDDNIFNVDLSMYN